MSLILVVMSCSVAYGYTDVGDDSWYYDKVNSLTENKIINGYSDGTFRPKGLVTVGEALKVILTVTEGDLNVDKVVGEHWAKPYLDIAIDKKLMDDCNIDLNSYIKRGSINEVIGKLLYKDYSYKVGKHFIDSSSMYSNYLYELGILRGEMSRRGVSANEERELTRAELSCIVYNLNDYVNDKLLLQPVVDSSMMGFVKEPKTEKDFVRLFLYMASNDMTSITVNYPNTNIHEIYTETFKANAKRGFSKAFDMFPEHMCYYNILNSNCTGSTKGCVASFELHNKDITDSRASKMHKDFVSKANEVLNVMIEDEVITKEMTDIDKAKVLFDFVCDDTKYVLKEDYGVYTGYGALVNREAVCQGYTATYNYMCRSLGIKVLGLNGTIKKNEEKHIWTIADLDGKIVHIDTTWGDNSIRNAINHSFFCANNDFMYKSHDWEEDTLSEVTEMLGN